MTDYTKIRSEYVKNKIKGLKMTKKNIEYINTLMSIERILTMKGRTYNTTYLTDILQGKYGTEWEMIRKELAPEHTPLRIERQKLIKEQKKIMQAQKKNIQRYEEESKRTWKLAGGVK